MPGKSVVAVTLLGVAVAGWFAVRIFLNPCEVSARSPLGTFSPVDRLLAEGGMRKGEPYPDAGDPSRRIVTYTAVQDEHGGEDSLSFTVDGQDRIVSLSASFLMRPEQGTGAMGPPLAAATFVTGYWKKICGSPSFEHSDTGGGAPSWGPFDHAWFGSETVSGDWIRNPFGQGNMDELWTLNDITISLKESSDGN